MPVNYTLYIMFYFTIIVVCLPTNTTVVLQPGTTNHGDPNLLCTPSSWSDIITFFLGNFVAHAATVLSFPGKHPVDKLTNRIFTLFMPGFGIFRGIWAISTFAAFGKTKVEIAKRAGNLGMVVRSLDWKPKDGDCVRYTAVLQVKGKHTIQPVTSAEATDGGKVLSLTQTTLHNDEQDMKNSERIRVHRYEAPWMTSLISIMGLKIRHIHGSHNLPTGYSISHVPTNAIVEPLEDDQACLIPSSYNRLATLIAIGQISFGAVSIYNSRGDQIPRYGYAAFGLTVVPYVIMSVVNLFSSLLRPEYEETYLVESQVMDEARRRGGRFSCTVGLLDEKDVTVRTDMAKLTVCDRPVTFNETKDGDLVIDLHPKSTFEPEVPEIHDTKQNQPEIAEMPNVTEQQPRDPRIFIVVENLPQDGSTSTEAASGALSAMLVPQCGPFKRILSGKLYTDYVLSSAYLKSSGQYYVSFHNELGWVRSLVLLTALALLVGAIPFAVIGGISGFRRGSSTYAQRVWIMTWLSLGQSYMFVGPLLSAIFFLLGSTCFSEGSLRNIQEVVRFALLCVPALGAFVVIGQMMMEYGNCISLS